MIIADTSQQQLQAYAVILAAKEKPCNIINVQDIDARDKQTTPTRTVRISCQDLYWQHLQTSTHQLHNTPLGLPPEAQHKS